MKGTEKLDELQFNDTVETNKLMPGLEDIVGTTCKYVGKTYLFEGSNGVLQEIKLWAEGFEHDKYEPE